MTGKRHKRSWQVDPLALRAACALLDVKLPVRVQYTAQYRTAGKHVHGDGEHVLRVSTYCSEEQASATLWHELAHAAQQERFGGEDGGSLEFAAAYRNESLLRGYQANAFEVEARAASAFATEYPLVQRIGAVRLKSDAPRWYEDEGKEEM